MKKTIRETVREGIEPIVTELGYRIWDITYGKIGADYHLEITIDSDNGIDIADCEKVHRAIDPVLDEIDPIEGFYYLEVSSPGLERELKNADHIYACEGWDVEVRLYAPMNGSKIFRGKLLPLGDDGEIRIENDGQVTEFASSAVAKLMTYFEM